MNDGLQFVSTLDLYFNRVYCEMNYKFYMKWDINTKYFLVNTVWHKVCTLQDKVVKSLRKVKNKG
jgi:acyl-ACP thioesterase